MGAPLRSILRKLSALPETVLLPCVLCVLPLLFACSTAQSSQVNTISGVLVQVDAGGITAVIRFAVRDAAGTVLTFVPAEHAVDENGRPLNASHMREHMLGAVPVAVEYRREGDTLIAERVTHQ